MRERANKIRSGDGIQYQFKSSRRLQLIVQLVPNMSEFSADPVPLTQLSLGDNKAVIFRVTESPDNKTAGARPTGNIKVPPPGSFS